MSMTTATTTTASTWNGPICPTCGAGYVGRHTCAPADILARIGELLKALEPPAPVDRTAGCPCRPENGGSGICGCVLSGPRVRCSA